MINIQKHGFVYQDKQRKKIEYFHIQSFFLYYEKKKTGKRCEEYD